MCVVLSHPAHGSRSRQPQETHYAFEKCGQSGGRWRSCLGWQLCLVTGKLACFRGPCKIYEKEDVLIGRGNVSWAVSDPMAICSLRCPPAHRVMGPWHQLGWSRSGALGCPAYPDQGGGTGPVLTHWGWGPQPHPGHGSRALSTYRKAAFLTQEILFAPPLPLGYWTTPEDICGCHTVGVPDTRGPGMLLYIPQAARMPLPPRE